MQPLITRHYSIDQLIGVDITPVSTVTGAAPLSHVIAGYQPLQLAPVRSDTIHRKPPARANLTALGYSILCDSLLDWVIVLQYRVSVGGRVKARIQEPEWCGSRLCHNK